MYISAKLVLQRKPVDSPTSVYKGGFEKYNCEEEEFFQFAVAFPSVDYRDTRMELYNILRILLGSASSFSSGGPGKGMHSRCTKNLLNKVACVENASFINEHFVGHGIFGLTVGGPHHQVRL
jgi:processing peptidase subunit alpha